MKSIKVFFIGTVHFSRSMLEVLLKLPEAELVGIATKSRSGFNADHTDLADLATAHDIPYKYVKDINAPHIVEWIKTLEPEVVFCFGWSSLIKTDLLNLAPLGVVGYHPAALPQNRGRHPIIWALCLGLDQTASTFFRMDEGADSGPILSQQFVEIADADDAASLYEKLTEAARQQVSGFVPQLATGTATWTEQDQSKATHWRKRGMKDGEIDFRMSSRNIYNLVRALTKPYVGAHMMIGGNDIKVWATERGPAVGHNHEPGKLLDLSEEGRILVKTGDGSIWLTEHELTKPPAINDYIA